MMAPGQKKPHSYLSRSYWYTQRFGEPDHIQSILMDDTSIELGIMIFPPLQKGAIVRPFWTYVTNGMSERRLPCEMEPRGKPEHRFELLAYTQQSTTWVADLLVELANYPFRHRTGYAIGHTFEVERARPSLWSGYLLSFPLLEPEEFSPIAIDIGIADWIFIAQVVGLKEKELAFGINQGGLELTKILDAAYNRETLSFLDRERSSVN